MWIMGKTRDIDREDLDDMLAALRDLGPNPTRASALRTLLPYLWHMFGDGYDLEATYGAELVAAHKKLEEGK
jgi:hypothetical protein